MNYIKVIKSEYNIMCSLIGESKANYMYNNILTIDFNKAMRMNKSSVYSKYEKLNNYYDRYHMEHSDNFKGCLLIMIDNLKYVLKIKERENCWNLMSGDDINE